MKRVLNRTLSMVLMAGFVGAPVMTALAQTPPEASAAQPAARGFESLSKQDLKELADHGAKRGEDVSDLRAYANGEQRSLGGGFLFKIKKKALNLLLDRGGPALEKVLKKFSKKVGDLVKKHKDKVIKAVKELDAPNEGMIRETLMGVGVSKENATTIAPFIHYMLD